MKQKKVLILGGSSDIGFETVKLFLNLNWQVTAHYNSRKINLKELKNKIYILQQLIGKMHVKA